MDVGESFFVRLNYPAIALHISAVTERAKCALVHGTRCHLGIFESNFRTQSTEILSGLRGATNDQAVFAGRSLPKRV